MAKKSAPEAEPEAAPPAANPVITLPLFSLVLSGLNVRHTERDADIAALAEDIAAIGLLQPLLVVPAHFSTAETTENYGDKFEVIGGGRRVQALKLLAEAGRLPHDHPVPVTVRHRDDARTVSLSENLHRVAMNPADEFEAFARIVEATTQLGLPDPVAACAKRFGVTAKHVAGRLRLASLAPEILDALRDGTITLDSAKAYAGTEDHAAQVEVFQLQSHKGCWKPHDPASVRAALRGVTLSLDDPLVKYAGLQAYRDAGGRTEVEMFMGTDGEERVTGTELVKNLAHARAERELVGWAEAHGWNDAVLAKGVGVSARIPPPPEGYTKAWDYGEQPEAEEMLQSIAVVAIDHEGDKLDRIGRFKPAAAETEQPRGYVPPTAEERALELRQQRIDTWSARLAVGPFAGTPLEGRVFWPSTHWLPNTVQWEYAKGVDPHEDLDAEPISALVHVRIRVTAEQIAEAREAAIARTDAIEAEEAARAAAKAAAEQEARDAEEEEEAEEDATMGEFEVGEVES